MNLMKRNLPLRLLFLALAFVPLVYWKEFLHHFYVYITGTIITSVIMQQWHIVVINIALFLVFLIPLSYRRKVKWTEYGLATAFFVSLFIEMYGIPLTILLASKYFFNPNTILPAHVVEFHFFGVGFSMDVGMTYGTILMIIGGLFILTGWVTLYRNLKKNVKLVTTGIYSLSRHPQYVGFILIIVGWLVAWPTILTVVLSPILVYKYLRVCATEEKEMASPEYEEYKKSVPMLI